MNSTKEPSPRAYEIRIDGETKCVSQIPRCGYSIPVLRSMNEAGYKYYIDGKYQKRSETVNGD